MVFVFILQLSIKHTQDILSSNTEFWGGFFYFFCILFTQRDFYAFILSTEMFLFHVFFKSSVISHTNTHTNFLNINHTYEGFVFVFFYRYFFLLIDGIFCITHRHTHRRLCFWIFLVCFIFCNYQSNTQTHTRYIIKHTEFWGGFFFFCILFTQRDFYAFILSTEIFFCFTYFLNQLLYHTQTHTHT